MVMMRVVVTGGGDGEWALEGHTYTPPAGGMVDESCTITKLLDQLAHFS